MAFLSQAGLRKRAVTLLAGAGLALLAGGARSQTLEVVASGLDNPRGLAFGHRGALYVAEAGRGGDGTCVVGGDGATVCYGATGAITRVFEGNQQRIVTGLPSLAAPDGSGATGPHDLALRRGHAFVVIGLGGSTDLLGDLADDDTDFARLLEVDLRSGTRLPVGDLAAHEAAENPDDGVVDTNPYAVVSLAHQHIVTDAGGNDLLRVRSSGAVETLAVFPPRLVAAPAFLGLPPGELIPMESVPTGVVRGPDHAYYVAELTGFPFPRRQARVYRVRPGHDPEIYASRFTNIIDLAFGPDGDLYVLEIVHRGLLADSATGALFRVAADGSKEVVAKRGLILPGGLAFGPDGYPYVSNCSACPAGAGEVVRIIP